MKKMERFIAFSLCFILVLSTILQSDFAVYASDATKGSVSVDKSIQWVDVNEGLAEVTVNVHANDQDVTTKDTKTTDIVLVLDVSNSMDGSRLINAKKAATNFATSMLDGDGTGKLRIAVVEYCKYATTMTEFSNSKTKVLDAIDKVALPSKYYDGATNIQAGLKSARTMLDGSKAENKFLILLSDGEPTYSYKVKDADFTLIQNDTCKNKKHDVKVTGYDYEVKAVDYTDTVGNGGSFYIDNPYSEKVKVYCSHGIYVGDFQASLPGNNGVATIYEASLFKNTSIYTIGFGVDDGSNADDVLSEIADKDQYFLSSISSAEINKVFNKIQTSVSSKIAAGEDAVVTSPKKEVYVGEMADKVLADYTVVDGSITTDTGSAALNDGEVDWNIGTLPNGTATLKYRIKIDMSSITSGNAISIAPSTLTYKPYIGDQLATISSTVNSNGSALEFFRVVFKNADADKTVLKAQYVEKNGSATAPKDPSLVETVQSKYTFAGWDGNYKNVTKDEVVMAKYNSELHKFTVTFKLDGTVVKEQTVEYGKNATAPTITKDDSKNYSEWVGNYTNVTKNEEVNMISSVKTYTVTFKLDGTVVKEQTVEYGKDATAPTITKEDSKNYSEWVGNYTNVTKNEEVNMTSSVKTYTVTFKLDGTVVKAQTVEYGKNATAPTITKDDSKNYSEWVGNYTNVMKNEEVNMTSSVKTFTVTFYVDGKVVKEQSVEYGKNATAPTVDQDETKNYSDWLGNYTDVRKDEDVFMTSSTKTFTVIFKLDGEIVKTQTVEYGNDATAPTITKEDSKNYSEWVGNYTNVTKNEVVNMTSSVKTFTVTFKLDGTVVKEQTVEYGNDATAPTITKEDSKNYSEWVGNYTNVTKNEVVNMTSSVKTFTVTFKLDGTVVKEQTVEYGNDATAPTITKEDSKNYSEWVGNFVNVMKNEEVNMTSSVKTFTVTFKLDGTVVKEQTVEYGNDATAPTITKEDSKNYSEWVGNFVNVMKNEEVNMTSSVKTFTVTFKLDGEVVKTQIVEYGNDATAPTITKEDSKNYSEWVGNFVYVMKNEEVNMTSSVKTFTVTFKLDGEVVKTQIVEYGNDATAPEVDKVDSKNYSEWAGNFVNVMKNEEVNMTSSVKTFTVTFKLNGTVVKEQTVEYGNDATAPEVDKVDSKNYSEWAGNFVNVMKDEEVNMTSSVKTFTVTFKLDGEVVKTQIVEYGNDATAPEVDKVDSKNYSEWAGNFVNVMKDEEVNMSSSVKTFTVTFKLDGEVVKEQTVEYGNDATAPEVDKVDSKNYSDWAGNFVNVMEDEEVNMTSSVKTFTVTFVDDNGTVLGTDVVEYGENATYTGKAPAKAADSNYTYNFKGWDKEFTNITADLTVVAQYNATPVVVIGEDPTPQSPVNPTEEPTEEPTVKPTVKPTVNPSKQPTIDINDDVTPESGDVLPETGTTPVEVYYSIGGMIMLLGVSLIIAKRGKKA